MPIKLDGSTGVITSTSSLTTGSVLFAGAGGGAIQDNANFFWDDTNNRLGIGTASPSSVLDIASSNSGITLTNTGASNKQWRIGSGSSGQFLITETGVADRLYLDTSGNFGVGISPNAKFQVKAATNQNFQVSGSVSFANSVCFSGVNDANNQNIPIEFRGAGFQWYNSGSPVMTLDANGRLRINTTAAIVSSAEYLSVNGMATISQNSSTAAAITLQNTNATASTYIPFISLNDGGGNRAQLGTYSDTAGFYLNGQFGIDFNTGGTSRARIDSSGNLLVGTTTTGGGKVCVKNTPSSQWGIDFNECEISIANNSNAAIPTGSGMVIINDPVQSGALGVYLFGGSSVVKVSSTDGTFVNPTTTPNAGTASIQSSSGTYRIYNNIGQTITFKVAMLRTRSSN